MRSTCRRTSCASAAARAARFGLGRRRGRGERARERLLVLGVDEHAGLGRHELGRPADAGRDDRAPARHRLQRREPERLDEARLTDDVGGREPPWDILVGDGANDAHSGPALELLAQRSATDEGKRPLAVACEGAGQADDVLALGERPETEERGPVRLPAELGPRRDAVRRSEALEVDAAVDHRRLARRLGNDGREPAAKPIRHRDHACSPPDGESGRRPDRGRPLGVRHVLAVRGQDGGRPSRERGEQARGDEEVRVDDVRPEPPRRPGDVPREREVSARSPAAVDDRSGELVAPRGEPALQVGHERAEVGRRRSRVHLRDEQDAQEPSAACDLQHTEAHLVGGAFAPQHVARLARAERLVVPAGHP